MSAPVAVRVHLVDDEPAVTRSLQWLLSSVGIDAECHADARQFLAVLRAREADPCCAVLDLRMPDMSGLELLEVIGKERPGTPVIFLSAHGDVGSAVRAMKLGAVDFLQKPFDPQTFLDCVAKAMRLAREQQAAREWQRRRVGMLERLSARERDLLPLVLEGASSKDIARRLAISPRTVDVHRASILHKLEVPTVRELCAHYPRGSFDPR